MGVQNNAPGGKGPCFDHAGDEGKREGMAGTARSNHPEGREPLDKVRRLQRKLWAAAKQQPERRFHALYDRIHRSDVLWNAWWRVRRNRGAAGVDAMTLAAVEEYGVRQLLEELQYDLQAGTYYADDFVVLCRTAKAVEEAERRVRIILERLRLDLHLEKTRRVT